MDNKDTRKEKVDSFINKTSLWIWFYLPTLFILSVYPIFYLISNSILYSMITSSLVDGLTENFQVVTFIIIAYLIYPVALLLLEFIPLFFLKKKENIKLYWLLSILFFASFLISFMISLFKLVIIPIRTI